MRAVVTDVEMPGSLDGFTFTRIVKQAWPHIGVVVVSGRKAPGPDDVPPGTRFLPKPYLPEELIVAVRSVLGPERPALAEPPLPVLPAAIKFNQPHTGIGLTGGLAQPLPEPEE